MNEIDNYSNEELKDILLNEKELLYDCEYDNGDLISFKIYTDEIILNEIKKRERKLKKYKLQKIKNEYE